MRGPDASLFFAAIVFAFGTGAGGGADAPAVPGQFRALKPEELVFFNVDHAPVGAFSTFVYGLDPARGGREIFAARMQGKERKIMPLLKDITLSAAASWIDSSDIRRKIGACSDTWTAGGLTWTHFSPSWPMADIDKASPDEKKCFFLPATWIRVTADNRTGKEPLTVLFNIGRTGVDANSKGPLLKMRKSNFQMAIRADTVTVMSAAEVEKEFGVSRMPALAVTAEPGQTKSFTIILAAEFTDKVQSPQFGGKFYYTSLFRSVDEVIECADAVMDRAIEQCHKLDDKLEKAPINEYRKFLAGHSLHSYRYCTICLIDDKGKAYWVVKEGGGFVYTNTFDLTVDHLFFELAMHPWTVRNAMDLFAAEYSFREKVQNPVTKAIAEGGIAFYHDMGTYTDLRFGKQAYAHSLMSQEELQNWILCSGLYWKKTGDTPWLKSKAKVVRDCLDSMLLRDDTDPAKRDGATDYLSEKGEITTYDALDRALKNPYRNLYITVKSWACYLALEAMLREIGDDEGAKLAREQAIESAGTVSSQWKEGEKYIPAIFDGKNQSRIIPAVEGLVYPERMGMAEAVSVTGPYGDMIRKLKGHLDTVLAPGVCLDKVTGAWKLSSTSDNTWQSKVYIGQYVAEKVFGFKGDRISGPVDAVHASFQAIGCAKDCWSDQILGNTGELFSSKHYPRGVTSALWWLD